jgi:Uma2 family endonuclease
VPELWYLDPETRTAEVLELGADGHYVLASRLAAIDSLTSTALPGLSLPVARLFPA